VDDDLSKRGKCIHGLQVFGGNEFVRIIEAHDIEQVLISTPQVSEDRTAEVLRECEGRNVQLKRMALRIESLGCDVSPPVDPLAVSLTTKRKRQGIQIVRYAPGAKALSIVSFLCSPQAVEYIFKPIVADWRVEYFEALANNNSFKARWICIRYSFRFVQSLGLNKLLSLLKGLVRAGK